MYIIDFFLNKLFTNQINQILRLFKFNSFIKRVICLLIKSNQIKTLYKLNSNNSHIS